MTLKGASVTARNDFIWAALLHMGTNMWLDNVPKECPPFKGEQLELVCAMDYVRFDESVWHVLTDRMVAVGMNMVVIDLGEAIKYPSHPELSVKGSWEVARFRKELARLRAMGLEPIPKMNFSTSHDTWLKEYSRMVSTPAYYKVCADLVRDVAEIFDYPRFLHLGYDEESFDNQSRQLHCVVRQGDLWWHDFLWCVKETETAGMRPWIWSDCVWRHPDIFYKSMPKSVLQSNWYYGDNFDVAWLKANGKKRATFVQAYEELDKAGFDQVPCGSNWTCDTNFASMVTYCRKVCSPERLKGFMMAPWFYTIHEWKKKNLEAIDQVGAVIHGFHGACSR